MQKEGVASNGCEFVDNGAQIALLLGKPAGLFSLLDEEAMFPRSTDATVIHKLHNKQGANTDVYDAMKNDQLHFKVQPFPPCYHNAVVPHFVTE
jgi:myosin heavy subunit